ncbi:MAG: TolC family protein [Lacipirellulaceae bacterium]
MDFRRKTRFLLATLALIVASGCATTQEYVLSSSNPKSVASGREEERTKAPTEDSATPKSKIQLASQTEDISLPSLSPNDLNNEVEESSGSGQQSGEDQSASEAVEELVQPMELTLIPPVAEQQQPVDYFIQVALSGHPKIQAAQNRVSAAANVIPQARALPDPSFNNTFWPIQDQALQTAGGRVGHQFQLGQGVPWPEKLRAKAAIASREVQIAQAELNRIQREITESVRLAYYEVWFATRAITIVEETRELVDDLTQVAEARYKSGGTQQDVLRAQLEADRLDDQLVGLRKQKEQAQADLAALVQQPVTLIPEAQQDIGLRNVPERLESLLALAEQCSPELRAIASEIQRDRQKQRLAYLQKYPDFNLGLNYAIIDDDTNAISPVANGHDNISFMVGFTLPIWREKINAGIREAANRTSSSAQRLQAERDAIQGKLRRLMAQADALVEQAGIYEDRIIPRTEDTLKLSFADYRGKRTDFFALIETYRELLMFETQLARIEATLAGTIAQIERTVGCPYGG